MYLGAESSYPREDNIWQDDQDSLGHLEKKDMKVGKWHVGLLLQRVNERRTNPEIWTGPFFMLLAARHPSK